MTYQDSKLWFYNMSDISSKLLKLLSKHGFIIKESRTRLEQGSKYDWIATHNKNNIKCYILQRIHGNHITIKTRTNIGKWVINKKIYINSLDLASEVKKILAIKGEACTYKLRNKNDLKEPMRFEGPKYIITYDDIVISNHHIRECHLKGIYAISNDLYLSENEIMTPDEPVFFLVSCKIISNAQYGISNAIINIVVNGSFDGYYAVMYSDTARKSGYKITNNINPGNLGFDYNCLSESDLDMIKITIENGLHSEKC